MTFAEKLNHAWRKNNSLVCVGLDPDLTKLPACLQDKEFPIFEFNKAIIDATADIVCSYKPQAAYYQGQNADRELKMTIDYILENYPEVPVILDFKRGDIGSTSEMYAKEAYERYKADACTLNPYMGTDTLKPFLDHADKGAVILCRTSNPSSSELQELIAGDKQIYKHVAELAERKWNYNNNVMLVIGATFPEELGEVRTLCPEIPFLVPGVGAQGGDVKKVLENGLDNNGFGLVINSSRGIIYADNSENFAAGARDATIKLNELINSCR